MTTGVAVLTVADLERAVAAAEPAALLVPPRILRRVIKKDAGLTGPGLQVPHRKSYVIRREALLAVADRADLGVPPDRELPEILLLFPAPDPRKLRTLPPGVTLLKYWRLLFHARVHQAVARSLPTGAAGEAVIRERIRRIGQAEADEARTVLRQENFLLHSHNLRSVYEEFVAVFLELGCFAPHRLPYYFPAIDDLDAIFRVLDADVDAAGLFAATRLSGAADPAPASLPAEEGEARVEPDRPPPFVPADEAAHDRLGSSAEAATRRGNLVRALLLSERAARAAPPDRIADATAVVSATVEQLTARLQAALGFLDDEAVVWRRVLVALTGSAVSGFWTREARLLYDLHRLCIDQERDVYAVDLVEWLLSWSRRPVVRPLPHQRPVHVVRRLRAAALRLASARVPEADRRLLLGLMHAAIARHEERMRDRFRPLLLAALDEAGLRPRLYVECIARDKIVEELLDRVVERGFLSMSDLRDALARNRLKLPDLSGPGEFVLGDPLLRANRSLALSLDGVYHRGEVYLRGLQRLSSLAFGTLVGRLLTLYLILPLVGAFIVLEGLQHVVHPIDRYLIHPPRAAPAAVAASEAGLLASPDAAGPLAAATHAASGWPHSTEFVNEYTLLTVAIFLLLLIHAAWFRRRVVAVLRLLWGVVRGAFYDLPAVFLRLPPVRAFFQSRPYLLFYLLVLKPLMWSALVALCLVLLGADRAAVLAVSAVTFLTAEALLQSRLGMRVEEACGDAALRGWRRVSRDLLPGLFRLVMAFFRRLLDDAERLIYTVDEWLRFRGGEGRGSLVAKAALGFVWFFVTYIVRFCLNLLIEPQINPIKHFPVVTVSHKLIFAFLVTPLTPLLFATMEPVTAGLILFVVQFGLPGIPGFLAWEFKENWRLYRANQPRDMRPQAVGGHGETIPRLLRPGFHSGTLPKLYARLRRVKAAGSGKPHEELHHVGEAVRRFVDRNLLAVLAGSKAWGEETLRVGRVHLASNRIRVALLLHGRAGPGVNIDLEEHGGYLVGRVAGPPPAGNGWLDCLELGRVRAFADALAGFYKAAGVDVVREQAEALLPAGAWFTFEDRGLVVQTGPAFAQAALYDLRSDGSLRPTPLGGDAHCRFRTLAANKLVYQRTEIRWDAWAEVWERDRAGKGHRPPLARGVQLLPLGTAKGRWAARRK